MPGSVKHPRRSWTVALSVGLIAATGATSYAAQATPATTTNTPAAQAAPAASVAKPDPAPRILRLWVKTGGRVGVSHARVAIVGIDGTVLRRLDSKGLGATSVPLDGLPSRFSIRVTGGTTVDGAKQNATLTVPVTPNMLDQVIFISPVTTIADQVSRLTKTSYGQSLKVTKRALRIPGWANASQFSGSALLFDPDAFHAFAITQGGHQGAIDYLAHRIAKGAKVPNFRQKASAQGRAPREADDAEEVMPESLAAKLATVALEAVVWKGTQAVVGKYLPVDPAMAQLSSQLNQISDQLATISEQLTTIQNDINEVLVELTKLSYNTAYQNVAAPVDDIPPVWTSYQQFAAEYACPYWQDPNTCSVPTTGSDSYENNATDLANKICGLANQSNGGQPMSLWSGLFTSPAGNTGVIPALYQMYSQDQAYWSADDLDAIYQTIDYYGTLQGEGSAMLNDAWSYIPQGKKSGPCSRPSTAASNDINSYVDQNNSLRASLPSGYTTPGIVVVPSGPPTADTPSETILQSFPVQSPKGAAGGKYSGTDNGVYATCSSGTTMSTSQYNQVFGTLVPLLPASQFTSTWESVIPDGYQIAHSSDLSTYQSVLMTMGDDSLTGLQHIVALPAGNIAQAVVTAESAPIASAEWDPNSAYVPEPFPAGIMWCNSATLGAANNDGAGWLTNFTMTTSNFGNEHVYADGLSEKNGYSVPLGVLATGSVKAHYVAPYDGAPDPDPAPCVPGQQDCVGDSISEATPLPGTLTCPMDAYCTGLEQANGEMIDDYNDHDVYSFTVPTAGVQAYLNGPVGSLSGEDPCTFCGFTIYNPAGQAIMTCPVAANCFTPIPPGFEATPNAQTVFFMVGNAGTYYVDVYRNGTLPNPTNVTYQVQVGWDVAPGCVMNCPPA